MDQNKTCWLIRCEAGSGLCCGSFEWLLIWLTFPYLNLRDRPQGLHIKFISDLVTLIFSALLSWWRPVTSILFGKSSFYNKLSDIQHYPPSPLYVPVTGRVQARRKASASQCRLSSPYTWQNGTIKLGFKGTIESSDKAMNRKSFYKEIGRIPVTEVSPSLFLSEPTIA